MQRYTGETERLVGILDSHLKTQDYLVGNKYSIADIASFGWVNILNFSGVDIDQFPNLKKWWQRINERPAVQRGLAVPSKGTAGNDSYKQRLKEDFEFASKEKELRDAIGKAKEQYGYVYKSP